MENLLRRIQYTQRELKSLNLEAKEEITKIITEVADSHKIRMYTIDWYRNGINYKTTNDVPKDKLPKYKEEAKYLGEKLKITYAYTISI